MLAFDLNYLNKGNYDKLSELEDETGKVLHGWIQSQK